MFSVSPISEVVKTNLLVCDLSKSALCAAILFESSNIVFLFKGK